jgi:hypothetical protein
MNRARWYQLGALLLTLAVVLLQWFYWRNPTQGPLVVWPERRVGGEYVVPWLYGDELTMSAHASKAEAARLYAVLAGKMRGGH